MDKKKIKIILVIVGVFLLVVITNFLTNNNLVGPEKILTLKIEEAQTSAEQARGLSGRMSLGEDEGMLFIFSPPTTPSFWMKEMNFPLDLIWLDHNYHVLGMEKSLPPDSYPKLFLPPAPVSYVLEVNAGYAARHGINVGDTLVFH